MHEIEENWTERGIWGGATKIFSMLTRHWIDKKSIRIPFNRSLY